MQNFICNYEKREVTVTEYNFIKDNLMYSWFWQFSSHVICLENEFSG